MYLTKFQDEHLKESGQGV